MNKRLKLVLAAVLVLGVLTAGVVWLMGANIAVLNPKGLIALKERNLMVAATLLSLLVVVPVFILLGVISWKYRAGNPKAQAYTPDWDGDKKLEFTWWAIPFVLIVVLGVIIWTSSHELDPYKPIASAKQPVTVQVVALQWKWLFIYPDQHIASVNEVRFPADTPVNFMITADAPMNSFWIPQLGGQVYAMAGMSTQLHLIASDIGTYRGSSANLSGEGFAGMKFEAKATSTADFDAWVQGAQHSPDSLDMERYNSLAKPSQNNPAATYVASDHDLYDKVIMKYMAAKR